MTELNKEKETPRPILSDRIRHFSKRLEALIEVHGSVRSYAVSSGLSEGVIRKYLKGDSFPTLDRLDQLAVAGGVELSWLATGEGAMKAGSQEAPIVSDEMSEFALIPGYDIQVAAGSGLTTEKEQITRKLAFRHKWLKFKGLSEKNLVLVFAKGDSMEPTIHDNNTLMIDTSQQQLNDGHIYVVRFNDHLVVKRIQTTMKGFYLISDNKEYEKMEISYNEADDLQIIGRIVWIGKDL